MLSTRTVMSYGDRQKTATNRNQNIIRKNLGIVP